MTNPIGDPGHGHSPAAWTAILIILVAVAIGTAALYFGQTWLVLAAGGLVIVGLIVGFILSTA
ncbi:MAG: HGxxPAAW family protein, partial [Candidatus Microbacterium stercoravium]